MTREELLIDYIKRFQGDGEDILLTPGHENTHGSYTSDLRNGFSFLGWTIKINLGRKLPRKPYKYGNSDSLEDSRFHPLFMCLNSSELLLITEALIKTKKEPLKSDLLKMILKQLTPTALTMLKSRHSEINDINFSDFELRNRQESEIFNKNYLCTFFLKGNFPVKVILKGTWAPVIGIMKDVPGEEAIIMENEKENVKIQVSQIHEITRLNREKR